MAMGNGEDKEAQLFTVTNSGPSFHIYLKIAVEIDGLPAAHYCLVHIQHCVRAEFCSQLCGPKGSEVVDH